MKRVLSVRIFEWNMNIVKAQKSRRVMTELAGKKSLIEEVTGEPGEITWWSLQGLRMEKMKRGIVSTKCLFCSLTSTMTTLEGRCHTSTIVYRGKILLYLHFSRSRNIEKKYTDFN